MIELDFCQICNMITRCPTQDIASLQKHVVHGNDHSYQGTFNLIWNSTIDFFQEIFPERIPILLKMESELIMSIYTAVFYETAPLTDKLSICKTIAYMDPIVNETPEDTLIETYRRTLYRSFDNLKDYYKNNYLFFNQSRKNSDLIYFKNTLEPKIPFKVFNEKDFFYYLSSIKHWPFFYENRDGMLLYDWFSTVSSLFSNIHNKLANESVLDMIFSDYILEQFYYPCRLVRTLSNYLNNFGDLFKNIKNSKREKSIVLSTVLSEMPCEIQNIFSNDYFSCLHDYLNEDLNDAFFKSIYDIVYFQYYFFPLAQSTLAYLLYHSYGKNINLIKTKLEDHISTNIDCFDYHKQIELALKEFKSLKYPLSKTYSFTDKVRNNSPIDTFNYNFTYYFFLYTPYFHYFDRQYILPFLSPEIYCSDVVKMFLDTSHSIKDSFTPNYNKHK